MKRIKDGIKNDPFVQAHKEWNDEEFLSCCTSRRGRSSRRKAATFLACQKPQFLCIPV
ncbi:hypothetical protein HY772_00725 [Candidatus Woesearchaeota archaeon]|nr:hypothetical protein [Candidatus Woesearchaeota archaeon]